MNLTAGFNFVEAIDLIRLSYITTALDPQNVEMANNPFLSHDQPATTHLASPIQPVWPGDWGPLPGKTWQDSIVCSVFPGKQEGEHHWLKTLMVGNTALVAYNRATGQYALAFAGTENKFGVKQDLAAIPLPAGPLEKADLEKALGVLLSHTPVLEKVAQLLVSSNRYIDPNYPLAERAQVDLGFRFGFESLFSPHHTGPKVSKTPGLLEVLELIPDGSDLLVTGFSLGGALATLATAWLLAGNCPKLFRLKVYTGAAPKSGNEVYANYLNTKLTNQQRFFRLYNTLDTVPEVPFTIQTPDQLNNPAILTSFLQQLPGPIQEGLDKVLTAKLPHGWSLNYIHAGQPIALPGELPIVYAMQEWPAKFFPGHEDPLPPFGNAHQSPENLQNWWQHQPAVYLDLLQQQIRS